MIRKTTPTRKVYTAKTVHLSAASAHQSRLHLTRSGSGRVDQAQKR